MKKSLKKSIFVFTMLASCLSAFAFGKRDADYRDVEEMDSWKETFDINEKKKVNTISM